MFHLLKDEIKSINSGSPDAAKCIDIIVPEDYFDDETTVKKCIMASLAQLNKPYRIWVWYGKEGKLVKKSVYPDTLEVDPRNDKLFLVFAVPQAAAARVFSADSQISFKCLENMALNKYKKLMVDRGIEKGKSLSFKNCRVLWAVISEKDAESKEIYKGIAENDSRLHNVEFEYEIVKVNYEKAKQRLKSQNLFKPAVKKQQTEEELRRELVDELKKYIAKIVGYLNTKEGFAHGFWVDKKDRAINREINYHLAKSLLQKLEAKPKQPLASVFADIQAQRKDVLTALSKKGSSGDILKSFLIFKKFSNKDVHSSTLKAIINKAKGFIKQPSPKKPQKT